MDGSREWTRRATHLVSALAMGLAPGMTSASGDGAAPAMVRLHRAEDRMAVIQAIDGAARRLEDPRCQALLTTFADPAGRPLRANLDAEGLTASDYLGRIYFYDGPAADCGQRRLAYTARGSRVVFVCGDRFRTTWEQNGAYAEAAIIHETLHSLGLGENPPTWQEITARVLEACRH